MGLRYKVVELTDVTDEAIETALNEWSGRGWSFDTMHFAMRESSKRPSMAFLSFTRSEAGKSEGSEESEPSGD